MDSQIAETVRWVLGGVGAVALLVIAGMAGIVKTMVVARFKSLDATVTAHFVESGKQQDTIERKLDDIRSELTSKIDEVRDVVHGLETRLAVLEKEHDLLKQSHCNNGGK